MGSFAFLTQPSTTSALTGALRTLTRATGRHPNIQPTRLYAFCASRPFHPNSTTTTTKKVPLRFVINYGHAQRRRVNNNTGGTPLRRSKDAKQQPSNTTQRQQQSSSPPPPPPPTTIRSRLAQLWKQYGLVSVAVYTAISTVDLALSFWLIRVKGAGFVKPVEDFAKKYLPDLSGYFGQPPHMPRSDEEEEQSKEQSKEMKKETKETKEVKEEGRASLSWWSTFAIAYGFHKLLVPLRVPLAAMATPSVARWIKRMGWKVVGWKVTRLVVRRR